MSFRVGSGMALVGYQVLWDVQEEFPFLGRSRFSRSRLFLQPPHGLMPMLAVTFSIRSPAPRIGMLIAVMPCGHSKSLTPATRSRHSASVLHVLQRSAILNRHPSFFCCDLLITKHTQSLRCRHIQARHHSRRRRRQYCHNHPMRNHCQSTGHPHTARCCRWY